MKHRQNLFFVCCIILALLYTSVYSQKLDAFLMKADSLEKISDYRRAESAYIAALKEAISIGDSVNIGNIYLWLGIVYEKQGNYVKTSEAYFNSLPVFQALQFKDRLAAVNTNIGNLYRKIKRYKDGLDYLNRSYAQWLELQDSVRIPYALNNIGLIFLDQDSVDKAMPYFEAVITKFANRAKPGLRISAMANIASILMYKGDYSKALSYYRKSLKEAKSLNDNIKIAQILTNISELYFNLKDYKNALKAQQQGLELVRKDSSLDLMRLAYLNLAKIYHGMGNDHSAYFASEASMKLQDSIYSGFKNDQIAAETKYKIETEKEKMEIEKQKNEIEKRLEKKKNEIEKNVLKAILALTILVIITILAFFKASQTRQRNERIIAKQNAIILESQLKNWELTALRAQMNPHFIFNALSSIKSYILDNNNEQADYYLTRFAKLIRLILDNSSQNLVSLQKELQLVESYIELEQLRFENKFTYDINIETEISPMEVFIPSMIIQPFIENAIIHGFLHKDGKCYLQINVRQSERIVTIIVEDNGIGRSDAKARSQNIFHESKGYKMTEQRLKALSQNRDENAAIVYKDLSDDTGNTGTQVEIVIPLQESIINA
jgi:tetratricopeptide (TPR) repeat protein